MMLFFLTQMLFAQPPALFEADCADLAPMPNGVVTQSLPYTQIEIRQSGAQFELAMYEMTYHGRRSSVILYDTGLQRYVARFANGEYWNIMRNANGSLTLQTGNLHASCQEIAEPAAPARTEIDRIWEAVQDVARGCGRGLEN